MTPKKVPYRKIKPSFELIICLIPILIQFLIVQTFVYEKYISYDDTSLVKSYLRSLKSQAQLKIEVVEPPNVGHRSRSLEPIKTV